MLKISQCELCGNYYRTGKLRLAEKKWIECGRGIGRTQFDKDKILVCKECYSKLNEGKGVESYLDNPMALNKIKEIQPMKINLLPVEGEITEKPKHKRVKKEEKPIEAQKVVAPNGFGIREVVRQKRGTMLLGDLAFELGVPLGVVQDICQELDDEQENSV